MRRLALTMVMLWMLGDFAAACPVCATRGREKTIIDHVVGSEQVTIARRDESEVHGQRYTISRSFVGERPKQAIVSPEDSPGLARRSRTDEDEFVFVRERETRPWQRYCGASFVDELLLLNAAAARSAWTGPEGAEKRARFFVPHVRSHPTKSGGGARIALAEVSRGSYSVLREAACVASRPELRWRIERGDWPEVRAVMIVLLSIAAEPEDVSKIERLYEESLHTAELEDLSAISSANIELHGAPAVRKLTAAFVVPAPRTTTSQPSSTSQPRTRARSRRPEDIEAVVAAFSVHGGLEAGAVRDAVIDAYSRVLDVAPALAALVAKDAFAWGHFDLASRIREIYEARGEAWSVAERTAIRQYIEASGVGF